MYNADQFLLKPLVQVLCIAPLLASTVLSLIMHNFLQYRVQRELHHTMKNVHVILGSSY